MAMAKRKIVRKLRHWKQRFDRNAEFIWRRACTFGPDEFVPGDKVPDGISPTKLRRFWESKYIELAEFEEPNVATGEVDPLDECPEGLTVTKLKGAWLLVEDRDGTKTKVNGQKALAAFIESWKVEDEYNRSHTLIGSSVLEASYEIGDETVELGDIVQLTFDESDMTHEAWNSIGEDLREELLARSLSWMQDQGVENESDGVDGVENESDGVENESDGVDGVENESDGVDTLDEEDWLNEKGDSTEG